MRRSLLPSASSWVLLSSLAATACSGDGARASSQPVVVVELGLLQDAHALRELEVRIPNTSGRPWEIAELVPSCGCLQVLPTPPVPRRVEHGSALELAVTYDPRGMRGPFRQDLWIRTASGAAFPVAEFSGTVVPEPFIAPESLSVDAASSSASKLQLTLPIPSAVEVAVAAPADLSVLETGRELAHGAQIVTYAVAPAADAESRAPRPGARRESIRFSLSLADEAFELHVPVLRASPPAGHLRNGTLIVPLQDAPGRVHEVALRRDLNPHDLAAAQVACTPAEPWSAEVSASCLRLRRMQEHIETAVELRLALPGGPTETLWIRPYSSSRP